MNKTIRKNKYIAPKIIEFDMKSTTILAGSGGPKTDTGGSKVDFNVIESDKNSWGGAKHRWDKTSVIGARRNKPKALAVSIVAMANADGGVIMKAERLHLLENELYW